MYHYLVHYLTEEKEVAIDGQDEEFEIKKKELLVVEKAPLLYTRASGNYHQDPQRKKLNHTCVVEEDVRFRPNEP